VTNKLTNSILTVSELVGTDANDALTSISIVPQAALPPVAVTNGNVAVATILATNSSLGTGITVYADGTLVVSSNFVTVGAFTNGGWSIGSLTTEAYRLTNTVAASQGYVLQYENGLLQWINTNWMGAGGGSGSFTGNPNQFATASGTTQIISGAQLTNITVVSGLNVASGATTLDNSHITTDGNGDIIMGNLTGVNGDFTGTFAVGGATQFQGAITNFSQNFGVDGSGKTTVTNFVVTGSTTLNGTATNNALTTVSNAVWGTAGGAVTGGWTNTTAHSGDMTVALVYSTSAGSGFGAVLKVTNWDGSVYSPVQFGEGGLTGLSESGSNSWTFPISSNSSAGVTVTAGTVVWGTPATIKWR
jgi:hypothetical protein